MAEAEGIEPPNVFSAHGFQDRFLDQPDYFQVLYLVCYFSYMFHIDISLCFLIKIIDNNWGSFNNLKHKAQRTPIKPIM